MSPPMPNPPAPTSETVASLDEFVLMLNAYANGVSSLALAIARGLAMTGQQDVTRDGYRALCREYAAVVAERDQTRPLIDAFARYADGRCDHFLDVAMRDLYRYRSGQGGPFFPASDEDLSIDTLRKERDAARDEIDEMRPVVEAADNTTGKLPPDVYTALIAYRAATAPPDGEFDGKDA